MATARRLQSRQCYWKCDHAGWNDPGIDLSEYSIGLATHEETMTAIAYLTQYNHTDGGIPRKKGFLRDLNWKLWNEMVWDKDVTEWNINPPNFPDIQETLREVGIPFIRGGTED